MLACLLLAFGGVWIGVRLASPGEYDTELGRISVRVTPSSHGELDAFIPLADWGVRARPYSGPVKIHVEPRTVDREMVLRAAGGDQDLLSAAVHDLREAVRRATLRALRSALLGAVAVALILLLVLLGRGDRRKRVLVGLPALVVALAVVLCGAAIARALTTLDENAFERPTFYARGAELVRLLDAAGSARQAGNDYESKVQGAVQDFATLLTDPTRGRVTGGRRAMQVSDLHDNRFALDSLTEYARGKPVFFVGDFGMNGGGRDIGLVVPESARLGSHVIAVSGNHDTLRLMRALARRGVTVLTRRGVLRPRGGFGPQTVTVDGLVVAGFDDPLQWNGRNADDRRRVYDFKALPDPTSVVDGVHAQIMEWFDRLPRRPDVVLIHQQGLAQFLAKTLRDRGDDHALTILTGHDHRQHIDRYGQTVVVDAGTVGAGGLYGVAKEFVGLADLHFSPIEPTLAAADLVAVEPVSGSASAQRVVNRACDKGRPECRLDRPRAGAG